MSTGARPAWLPGPVNGVPPLLQPVAHALLEALTEPMNHAQLFGDPPS